MVIAEHRFVRRKKRAFERILITVLLLPFQKSAETEESSLSESSHFDSESMMTDSQTLLLSHEEQVVEKPFARINLFSRHKEVLNNLRIVSHSI